MKTWLKEVFASVVMNPQEYSKIVAPMYWLATASLICPFQVSPSRSVITIGGKKEAGKPFAYCMNWMSVLMAEATLVFHHVATAGLTYAEWEKAAIWQQAMLVFLMYGFVACLIFHLVIITRQDEIQDTIVVTFIAEGVIIATGKLDSLLLFSKVTF